MKMTEADYRLKTIINNSKFWEIIEKYGIHCPGGMFVMFIDTGDKLIEYVKNIKTKKSDYSEIIPGNNIQLMTLHYFYSNSTYISAIPSNEKAMENFKYTKEALLSIELPIGLEYKMKSAPTLDWNEKVTCCILKENLI